MTTILPLRKNLPDAAYLSVRVDCTQGCLKCTDLRIFHTESHGEWFKTNACIITPLAVIAQTYLSLRLHKLNLASVTVRVMDPSQVPPSVHVYMSGNSAEGRRGMTQKGRVKAADGEKDKNL